MKPAYKIIAANKDITALIKDRLISITVKDEAGFQSDSVEIKLDNRQPHIELPITGVNLDAHVGYEKTGLVYLGSYEVDEVALTGPPHSLTIQAKAAKFSASFKAPKTRSWDNLILPRLVETIAHEHGYIPVLHESYQQQTYPHVDQTNESDMHLLTRLAQEIGAIAKPVANRLVFLPKGESKGNQSKVLPTISIPSASIVRYQVNFADRGKYRSVKARWYDAEAAMEKTESYGEGRPAYAIRKSYAHAEEAQQAVKAKFESLARGKATLSLTLLGMPELFAESKVAMPDLVVGVPSQWIVTSATHQITASGFMTQLRAKVGSD